MTMEWQPIETAPRDGTRVILAALDEFYVRVAEGYFDDEWFWSTDSYRELGREGISPTHWMPLPEPPNTKMAGSQIRRNVTGNPVG